MLSTLCLKKVPAFELIVTFKNINRFSKFWHCWITYEISNNRLRHHSLHLRHVATLPWEIKNLIFLQMWKKTQKNPPLITRNFVIHSQILIFFGV